MAGVDDGLVRQCAKTIERALELCAVGKREIRTPHGAGKQAISNEGDAVSVYRDVSRRMARHVDHGELQRSHIEHVTVSELAIGRRGLVNAKAENHRVLRSAIVDRALARVKVNGHSGFADDTRNPADMVHVGVGQPNGIELSPIVSNRREKTVCLFTRIDQDRAPRCVINDEVRVLLERANGKSSDDHTAYPPLEVSSGSS
jgi:hypothetical protein